MGGLQAASRAQYCTLNPFPPGFKLLHAHTLLRFKLLHAQASRIEASSCFTRTRLSVRAPLDRQGLLTHTFESAIFG
jgi:hypothetical protein